MVLGRAGSPSTKGGDGLPFAYFPHRYAILSMESFELAVDTAHSTDTPLYELLSRHYEQSAEIDHSTPAADLFGGADLKLADAYATRFVRELVPLPEEHP